MSHPTSQHSPSPDTTTSGHEPDRASKRALGIFVVALAAFAVATAFGLWWLLGWESKHARLADVPRSVVEDRPQAPSDAPSLQPTQTHDRTPRADLAVMRDSEDHVFTDLGWQIDPATHAPRIPDAVVERVATITRGRQLPTTPSTSPATSPVITPIPGIDQGGAR